MHREQLSLIFLMVFIAANGFCTEVSGPVSGIWDPTGNPYEVVGDINIPPGQTLIIAPGVEVIFQGRFQFAVEAGATLSAIGTISDSITFTAQDTSRRWLFIYFQSSSDNSAMEYCLVEYGGSVNISTGYGAVTIQDCDVFMRNCEIRYNHSRWGGGIYCRQDAGPFIEGCSIHHNRADNNGGGFGCSFNVTADIIDCDIHHNTAGNWGGGVYIYSGSTPTIDGCRIYGNTSFNSTNDYGGGGLYVCADSRAIIDDCWIYENSAVNGSGGGICTHVATIEVNRTVICSNAAEDDGGGVAAMRTAGDQDTTYITDCDIYANNASGSGGGIKDADNFLNQTIVRNSVVWANTAPSNPQSAGQIRFFYCDVSQNVAGSGNINADPMFVFPDTMNFNLLESSPCIDAGDPNPIYNDPDSTIGDIGTFYYHQYLHVLLSPDSLSFDTTNIGEPDSSEFQVVNPMNVVIWVEALFSLSNNYLIPDTNFYLNGLDTVVIPAVFIPQQSGPLYGSAVAFSCGTSDTIHFYGYGEGDFYLYPGSLDFEDVLLGSTDSLQFWAFNQTSMGIQVDSMVWGDSAFAVLPPTFNVQSQDSAAVTVTFTPYHNGAFRDTLIIYASNNLDTVFLAGEGYGFYLQPEALIFDSIGVGTGDTMMVQAVNLGALGVSIDSVTFSSQSFSAPGMNFYAPPNDTIDIELVFTPAISGLINDTAIFHSSVGTDTMILSGYGIGWEISPDTLNFGAVTCGSYDTLNFCITNFEAESLCVDSMTWGDSAFIIENTFFTVPGEDMAVVPVVIHSFQPGNHQSALTVYTERGEDNICLTAWVSYSGLGDDGMTPLSWEFPQPHPNPFNTQLYINFTLPSMDEVSLSVWNVLGRKVASLEESRLEPGLYRCIWNAEEFASGMYLVRLKTSSGEWIRKVMLLK